MGVIERNSLGHLRTTDKWYSLVTYAEKTSAPPETSSAQTPEETSDNNNNLNKPIVQGKPARTKKAKEPPVPWTKEQSREYIEKMSEDPQAHVRLLAYYFKRKGMVFPSNAAFQDAFDREVSFAAKLISYPKQQIVNTMDHEDSKKHKAGYVWKLSTILKNIDHVSDQ